MPENDKTDGEPGKAHTNDNDRQRRNAGLRVIVLSGGIILGVLLFVSVYLPSLTERVKFFTVNALSVSILVAVAVQAFIYARQWRVMERQSKTMERSLIIGSRAYVCIRSIRMLRQIKTVVLVEIENVGNIPAEKITLFLQLFMIKHVQKRQAGGLIQKVKRSSLSEDYGRTKLSKGNLPIALTFNLHSELTEREIRLIHEGEIGLILRGYIQYADGFSVEPDSRTEFYFDYLSEHDLWSAGPPDYGDIIGDEDSDWDDQGKADPN